MSAQGISPNLSQFNSSPVGEVAHARTPLAQDADTSANEFYGSAKKVANAPMIYTTQNDDGAHRVFRTAGEGSGVDASSGKCPTGNCTGGKQAGSADSGGGGGSDDSAGGGSGSDGANALGALSKILQMLAPAAEKALPAILGAVGGGGVLGGAGLLGSAGGGALNALGNSQGA
jgi:hypothetical protein